MIASVEHEDLGLSLSLAPSPAMMMLEGSGGGSRSPPFRGAAIQSSPPPPPVEAFLRHRSQLYWSDLLARSDADARPMMLKGIDVNRSAVDGEREIEDDAGASSPNSTSPPSAGSAARGGGGGGVVSGGGDASDRACSRSAGSDEEDGGEGSRKKLRLSKNQSEILEHSFKDHNTLNPKEKLDLAKRLKLRPRQVEVWFQNRRARTKLKQTEVDCEQLNRCCESLTEENRRLQKEVAELRAMKLSPHQNFYMHMPPPTTLTMCPSCERVDQQGVATAVSQPDIRRSAATAGAAKSHRTTQSSKNSKNCGERSSAAEIGPVKIRKNNVTTRISAKPPLHLPAGSSCCSASTPSSGLCRDSSCSSSVWTPTLPASKPAAWESNESGPGYMRSTKSAKTKQRSFSACRTPLVVK